MNTRQKDIKSVYKQIPNITQNDINPFKFMCTNSILAAHMLLTFPQYDQNETRDVGTQYDQNETQDVGTQYDEDYFCMMKKSNEKQTDWIIL